MSHGLSRRARAGVSVAFHLRARAVLAALVSLGFIAATSSPALADQARRNEWWLRTLHVTNAWQTTRGSGVTVAVLDTGVNPAQADLTGSVTTGPDYSNSGRTAGGRFWGIHGTEVASLIAGHGHGPGQANGVIGIAPRAKILALRVTLESNDPHMSGQTIAAGLPDAIARGIRWAVRHDASVIDLPLDPVTAAGAPGSGGSTAERAAIGYALAKHVVLVAPAGDNGTQSDAPNFPAMYRGVIAVGAFDRHFVKAPFSSHQPYVTVTAAGAGVTAANPAGSYPQLNSTSAASAMVAGIVALIRAQFPVLTPAQVTKALTTSTGFQPRGGRANGSGFGTVDAAKALTAAAGIAEAVSKSAASGGASGQAPPSPPAVHSAPIHRSVRGTLIKDAAIAGVVFVLLLGLIFGVTAWRRRHARSARLAEVRAAAQLPAAGKKAAKAKGPAKRGAPVGDRRPAGHGGLPAEAAEPQLDPADFIAAPLGPGAGGPGPAGFTGASFTGSSAPFTGSTSSPRRSAREPEDRGRPASPARASPALRRPSPDPRRASPDRRPGSPGRRRPGSRPRARHPPGSAPPGSAPPGSARQPGLARRRGSARRGSARRGSAPPLVLAPRRVSAPLVSVRRRSPARRWVPARRWAPAHRRGPPDRTRRERAWSRPPT